MPNEQNLIVPSSSEARKNGAKGGKKSGEVRRRKKTMKQVMDFLLEQPANTRADYEFLVEQGIDLNSLDPDFINNMLLVNAALMARAKQGDVAAVKELRDIIRDDDMLKHKIKYDNARLRLEKQKLEPVSMPDKAYSGIPASLVAPTFSPVLFDIAEQEHSEYVFPGGRGSTKSSFCGLNVIDLLMKNENMHVCVLRSVANTLKDSVYSQILWAISALGLDDEFACTKSPLEITRISTGQKIYFRGADDPHKIKSIKPPFGYIGIVWFEELDQFGGEEAVRTIEQSVIRGGERAYKFKSFNPPKSAQNWANKYIKVPRTDRLVTESTYLTVPKKWLGKPFLDDAEFLKETNPTAYENEYMGVAAGTSGDFYHEFSPQLRQADFIAGLEEYKREIEFAVGLSYGDISNPQTVDKTATEIKSSKQRKFDTVTAIQNNLRVCLEDLCYSLAFYNGLTQSGYELSVNFEDSILADDETKRASDRQDVSMGIMPLWEYRMKWYGEDEETAKKMTSDSTAEVIE